MVVGILALQGAIQEHEQKLRALSCETHRVRTPADLLTVDGLILPGGESTAMIHLIRVNGLWNPLSRFLRQRPAWGVCAGAILLAKKVTCPAQSSLDCLDIEIERNAYGRQVDSFIAPLQSTEHDLSERIPGVFIRAPKIKSMGPSVTPLFRCRGEVVMVEQDRFLASTFHPELSESSAIHEYFLRRMTRI